MKTTSSSSSLGRNAAVFRVASLLVVVCFMVGVPIVVHHTHSPHRRHDHIQGHFGKAGSVAVVLSSPPPASINADAAPVSTVALTKVPSQITPIPTNSEQVSGSYKDCRLYSHRRQPASASGLPLLPDLVARLYYDDGNATSRPARAGGTSSGPSSSSSCSHVGGWHGDSPITERLFSETCNIPRVDISRISDDDFVTYIEGHRPVLFVDPTGERIWDAYGEFFDATSRSSLKDLVGQNWHFALGTSKKSAAALRGGEGGTLDLRAGDEKTPDKQQFLTFDDYLRQMDTPWVSQGELKLNSDFIAGSYDSKSVPPQLQALADRAPYVTERWMQKDPKKRIRVFNMGATASGAPFHRHDTAWSLQVHGLKRWFLKPPRFDFSKIKEADKLMKLTSVEWYLLPKSTPGSYQDLKTSAGRVDGQAEGSNGMMECVQVPGETLYIPPKWWHVTLNLGQSISVSQFDL